MDMLDLKARKALPETLRVLLQAYPRDAWADHSNMDDLTRFWLGRHVMFRNLLESLRGETEMFVNQETDRQAFTPRLQRLGGMFFNELHTHHMMEDQHYFPQLEQLESQLARGFALLDADHQTFDTLLNSFEAEANSVLRGADAEALHQHLSQFETFLNRHLTDEEEIVVPILLKYGPGAVA